jgi:hypothetical protein
MTNRSESDFAHFFVTDLLKQLKWLETRRLAVLRNVKILFGVIGGVSIAVLAVRVAFGLGWSFVLVTGILSLGGGSAIYRFLISGYVHEFKSEIIQRIVRFIDPGLAYTPGDHVSARDFHSSRIFTHFPDRMRGDDLVEGTVGSTAVRFSEVHAEYRSKSSGGDRDGGRYRTIFKGLFFMAEFNKKFYGKTVILPDTAERMLGGLGCALQGLSKSHGELIRMDNPGFEKYFVVYGDDQIESRYVLSTSLVQRILDFRTKTGKRIYLSFVGSVVYVAIPYRRPLLEPKVFSSITTFRSVRECFDDLRLALSIVADLNLNTRIWAGSAGDESTRVSTLRSNWQELYPGI